MQRLYKKDISALSSATLLHNYYDPSGEKVGKATIYGSNTSAYNIYTWYVRDAQGNVMAVYQTSGSNITTTPLMLLERYMYGSSRLGSISENRDMSVNRLTPDNSNANLGTAYLTTFTRGKKFFEVTNHLGTVMTILNDRHIPRSSGGGVVTGYNAVMQFAADYTPFGMEMLGMTYGSGTSPVYRYKFNGKERIYEINGSYNQYDYGARIYDDRLGRFFSVDPLTKSFPWYSPYHYAGNSPISNIDLDGKEDVWFMIKMAGWMMEAKLNNEVESVGRLASGQSGDANIPKQIQGPARNMMGANQTVKDLGNAVDYFKRPYEITNEGVSLIFPEAAVLNGMYQISEGNNLRGSVEMVFGGVGTVFKALSFSERAYVNGVLKTVNNDANQATKLFNEGVRDFNELDPIVIKLDKTPKHFGGEFIDNGVRSKDLPLNYEKEAQFTLDDFNSFSGAKPESVKSFLEAKGWKGVKTNPNRVYNDGMRYTRGVKGEQIRIMPGGATRSIPKKTGPYMEISTGGKKTVVPLAGNPTIQ